MATLNFSSADDVIVPTNSSTTYRGLGGPDIYILSKAIKPNSKITIVDTNGSNIIQLIDGLAIASSRFAADALELTLSNGAKVTINGTSNFTFEISGNATTATSGTNKTYEEFASMMGVSSLPDRGLKSGSENLIISNNSIVQEGLPKLTWEVSVKGQPDYNIINVSATSDKTIISGTNDDDDFRVEVTSAGVLVDGPYGITIENFDKDNDKITFIINDGSSRLTTQEFDSLSGVEVTSDGLSGTQIYFAPDSNAQSGFLTIEGLDEPFDNKWEANNYSAEITPLEDLFVDGINYYPINEGKFIIVTITSDKIVLKDTIIEVYNGNSDDWSLSEPYNSEKQEDGSYASTVQVIMKKGTQEVSFQVLAKSDEISEVTQKMNIKMYTLDDSFVWDFGNGESPTTLIPFKIFDQSSSSASPSYTLTKSSSSVDEGDEVTFTITASSAVTSDTQFSWSIEPDDNGNTVDKASSSDIDAESGTATIASGATSTTFSIKALNDSEEEGIEGIKVSVLDSNSNSIGSEEILISNITNDIKGTDGNDSLTLTKDDDDFEATLGKDTINGGAGEDTITVLRGTKIIKSQDVFGSNTGTKDKVYLQIQLEGETDWTYAYNFEKIQIKGEDTFTLVDDYFSKSRWDVDSRAISDIIIDNNTTRNIDLSDSFYTFNADTTMNYSIDFSNDKVSDQITLSDSTLSFKGGNGGDTYTVTITARGTQKFSDNFNFSTSDYNYDDQIFTVTLSDDDYIEGQTGTSSDDNITLPSSDDSYEYTIGTDKIDGGAGSDTLVVNSEDVSIIRAIDVRGEDAYTGVEGKEFLYVIPKTGSGYTIATNFEKIQYDNEIYSLDSFTSYSYYDVSSWQNDTEGVKIQDQSVENNESKTINLDTNFFTINKDASLSYSVDFSNDKVSDQILISGSNLNIQGGVGGDKYEVEVTVRATQAFSSGGTLRDDLMYEEDTFTITLSDDDYVAVNASNNTTPNQTDNTTITVTEDIPGGVLLDLTSLNIDPGTVKLTSWAWGSPLTKYNIEGFSENLIYIDEKVLKLKDGAWFDVDRSLIRNINSSFTNATDGQFQITFNYKTGGVSKEHTLTIADFVDTPYGHGLYSDGNFLFYTEDEFSYSSNSNIKATQASSKWINTSSNSSEIVEIFYSFVTPNSKYIREASDSEYYRSIDEDDIILNPTDNFKDAVKEILANTSSIFKLKFTELTNDDVDKSNIRFVLWDSPSSQTAGYAWDPSNLASFVFILKVDDNDYSQGSFVYGTIRHEIGHALGLAHPFEGDYKIDSEFNSILYTVMAYKAIYDTIETNPYNQTDSSYILNRTTGNSTDPSDWAMYDIAALKSFYGLRSGYNSADNTYSFTSEASVETIHDLGGYDTIDLTGSSADNDLKSFQINLGGGAVFQAGDVKITWTGDSYQTGQIFTTSFDTEIEKFIGSNGADNVRLGPTSDTIITNGGDDRIYSVGYHKSIKSIKVDAGSGDDYLLVYFDTDEVNALLDINGGSGYDRLSMRTDETNIDLSLYMKHFDNFELYSFINSNPQTITIDAEDFIEVSSSYLAIIGGTEDTVILPDGAVEDTSLINANYDYYTLNDVTIAIHDDLMIG